MVCVRFGRETVSPAQRADSSGLSLICFTVQDRLRTYSSTLCGIFGYPFSGSICVSPVSSQSTDLPNSRLIARRTAAPGSFSPRSRAQR